LVRGRVPEFVTPYVYVITVPALTPTLGDAFLVRASDAVPAVFVMVQLMLSPFAGVTENDVPLPLGSVVDEPPFVLVHEIELPYCPITDADPAAIASVSVYVVPLVSTWLPVVAVVPAPLVVADATVAAPFLIATVNWSDALARDATDFTSVRWGLAVFVIVQVMLSAAAGVSVKDVPLPLGNVVLEPAAPLVHEIELR
jgi:hypothetical protein